ncbi:LCP family protein [Paenibacillus turpanensis]|uniref:LCP family protein n=1 Tax=Paenibacillus turpanensis TaxID=2689078 RepID=UPI0014092DB4|nr:LCP family protein [Paenibacillus turpanensis]
MKTIRRLLTLMLLAILGVIGYYGYSVYHFATEIQKAPEQSRFKQFMQNTAAEGAQGGTAGKTKSTEYTVPKWEGQDRVNILLLGGDSRGLTNSEVPRSDTMMVVSVDPVSKNGHIFSILRDTYVHIPDHGKDRANAALAIGGPELAMRTVGDLLGLPIQYYVYTDFEGFVALVDSIGGIDFEVEKNMKYISRADGPDYDINLKKGMQHLDGKQALGYVRFRHDALSDFARTERQRNFMQAIGEKMQQTSSLIKLPYILSKIDPYIETNLTVSEMAKLAALGFEVKAGTIGSSQIPPSDLLVEDRVGGASVITVNTSKLQTYVQEQFLKDAGTGTQLAEPANGKAQPAVR